LSKKTPNRAKSTVETKKTETPKKRETKEKKVKLEKKNLETKKKDTSTPLPIPMVNRAGRIIKKMRQGRGFSISELGKIGLEPKKARKLGLRVDTRRSTELIHNVDSLKKVLIKSKKTKDLKNSQKVKKVINKPNSSK